MKKLAVLLLLLVLLPLNASANRYDGLTIFGDSLSDTHNEYDAQGTPGAPYYQGRYSNGLLWIEDLAPKLGLTYNPATDFAVAGSTTGTINLDYDTLPGMQLQVAAYLASRPVADPNSLYIVWGGANDYGDDILNGKPLDPFTTVGNILGEVQTLAAHGARNFLIPNLGNLADLPFITKYAEATGNPLIPTFAQSLTTLHNSLLLNGVDTLRLLFPDDNFTLLDIYSKFEQVTDSPSAYGLSDVTSDYLDYAALHPGTTVDPNSFLFFDDLHPTASGHALIAEAAYAALTPEPGEISLFAGFLVSASVFGLRRRKQIQS